MTTHADDRDYWLQTMQRIAKPVLEALSQRKLKERMPVEAKLDDRELYTYLEAYGRLLAGIAPWLEHGPETGVEGELRGEYVRLAQLAMDAATDPQSPDRMNFSEGYQPIVDAAFLAHAILRAPTALWSGLDDRVKANVTEALRATRSRKPWFNNWLLFAAMIEAALCVIGDDTWDPMRIDYALKQHEHGRRPLCRMGRNAGTHPAEGGALRRRAGTVHFSGRNVSRRRTFARLPLRRVPAASPDGVARAAARRCRDGPSALCADRGDAPHDRSAGHVRCGRLADDRLLRASAGNRGTVHFHRQLVLVRHRLSAARAFSGSPILAGRSGRLDVA